MSPANMEGRSRASDCLSDLALDRLLSEERSGSPEETQHRAHIAHCARCAERFRTFREQAAEFRRRAPRRVVRAAPRPAPRRLLPVFFGVAAAAAAVLIVLLLPPTTPDGIRLKGGLQLEAFVKHPSGAVEQLLPGGTAMPGDTLRFRVFAPRAGFLALLSVDGAGRLSSYLAPAPTLRPLRAGARQELDGAIDLDEVLGAERLIALLCPQQLTVETTLVRAQEALRTAGPNLRQEDISRAGLDCALTTFQFVKVARR